MGAGFILIRRREPAPAPAHNQFKGERGTQFKLKQSRTLSQGSRITQITGAMVQSAPTFDEVVDDVLAALAGRVFVAHNVGFDWRFVSAEVRRARDLQLDGPKLCTVKLTRRFLPSLKNRGLDSVARYFGVEIEHRHRAGGDARATALILKRLLDTAAEQGATTLEDVSGVPPRRGRRKRRSRGPTSMDAI